MLGLFILAPRRECRNDKKNSFIQEKVQQNRCPYGQHTAHISRGLPCFVVPARTDQTVVYKAPDVFNDVKVRSV